VGKIDRNVKTGGAYNYRRASKGYIYLPTRNYEENVHRHDTILWNIKPCSPVEIRLEDRTVSIFRDEEQANEEANEKQAASRA
jgi:hypothetical protein